MFQHKNTSLTKNSSMQLIPEFLALNGNYQSTFWIICFLSFNKLWHHSVVTKQPSCNYDKQGAQVEIKAGHTPSDKSYMTCQMWQVRWCMPPYDILMTCHMWQVIGHSKVEHGSTLLWHVIGKFKGIDGNVTSRSSNYVTIVLSQDTKYTVCSYFQIIMTSHNKVTS